jgi:hypothetical protein
MVQNVNTQRPVEYTVCRLETSTQSAEAQGVIKFANLSVMLKSKYTESFYP